MKHICIITSALFPLHGVIPPEDRFKQTLHSIKTTRDKIPGCIIILNDVSVYPCDTWKQEISKLVDVFIDSSTNNTILELSRHGRFYQSRSELLLYYGATQYIKQNFTSMDYERIFKLSGRQNITEEFDIGDYDEKTVDKYVMKNSVQSWILPELRIYETRLWSMHKNNLDDYLSKFEDMFNSCDGRYDLEHAHYKFLDKKDVVEFDNIWVEGRVALNGRYQKD